MKIKTSELTGAALDWAVAKCEWYKIGFGSVVPYSTDWAKGGPIIERERLQLRPCGLPESKYWVSCPHLTPYWEETQEGPTPLIAAMRCYVALTLGEEIETPFE